MLNQECERLLTLFDISTWKLIELIESNNDSTGGLKKSWLLGYFLLTIILW